MAHRVVALQTSHLPPGRCRMGGFDRLDNFSMTGPARLFSNGLAVRLDLNVVLVASRSEEKRVPEAIRCFRHILAEEVCRRVTAIAVRHRAMRGLEPAVELLLHDMAVGA